MEHTWVIGKTGTGKSTFLLSTILERIHDGIIFIDPHGHDIDLLVPHLPKKRRNDVILFDIADFPIGLNILEDVSEENRPFVASSIVDAFKSAWGYSKLTTPLLDQYLYNTTAALLDVPDGTLMGIKFMLTSPTYRDKVIAHIKDPVVREFWEKDFERLTPKEKRETTLSTVNKIQILIADPRIRNVIGQPKSGFNLADVFDKGQILLVKLPQGKLGLWKTRTVGALLLSYIHSTALSRTSTTPLHLFIDECHHFGTSSLIEMLSGIRKFNVSLTLANQYIAQLSQDFRDALIGNVQKKVAFRTGFQDDLFLREEFYVNNTNYSLSELPMRMARIATGNSADEKPMQPLPDPPHPNALEKIRRRCINQYSNPHAQERIERFIENMQ